MNNISDKEEIEISTTCLRKCINDFNKMLISPSEKICMSRCSFKFIDAVHYGDRLISMLENKINSPETL